VRLMARRSESGIGADEPPHLRSLVEHGKNKPHFRQSDKTHSVKRGSVADRRLKLRISHVRYLEFCQASQATERDRQSSSGLSTSRPGWDPNWSFQQGWCSGEVGVNRGSSWRLRRI
jgi:hypothetical protein